MEALAVQKRLLNKKWKKIQAPKRWTRDPIIPKKHTKKVKRKKAKRHTVKAHRRGGSVGIQRLRHGSLFVGGSLGNDTQQVFHGTKNTYFRTRINPKKRRHVDFRGRLAMKTGNVIG